MAQRKVWDTSPYYRALQIDNLYDYAGRISRIVGMTVEATGVTCNVGDVCHIQLGEEKTILAEVVGFQEKKVLLMPYEDIDGIGFDSIVRNTGEKLMIRMSNELIGRTVDALGNPIDGGPPIQSSVS